MLKTLTSKDGSSRANATIGNVLGAIERAEPRTVGKVPLVGVAQPAHMQWKNKVRQGGFRSNFYALFGIIGDASKIGTNNVSLALPLFRNAGL